MPNEQQKTITDETEVSTTELASVLGITARRVQQLIQDGTFQTERRGWLLLADNVQRYITFITGNNLSEKERKLERGVKAAEAKIKMAKATVAQLEADELSGKMHRSEDVAAVTNDLVDTIRGMLNALPGQLAVDVSKAGTAEECSVIIRDSVNAIMRDLSQYQYDPSKYDDLVRGRRDWMATHNEQVDEDD